MPKKSAIAVALSLVGVVVTASLAVALNLGILGDTAPETTVAEDDVTTTVVSGDIDAADEPTVGETRVVTVYVDEPAAAPSPTGEAPVAAASTAVTAAGSPGRAASEAATSVPVPAVTYPIYDVGEAGQVALEFKDGQIAFWGAYPNDGWDYAVEDNGPREVEVSFRSGNVEIEFKAVLRNGEIQVRFETETEDHNDDHDDDDDHDDHDDDHDDDDHDDDDHDDDDDDHDDDDHDDDDD